MANENDLSGPELKDACINAAEIMLLSGNLGRAAQLFEKASLAEKGKKDFESLYRAALINVETAEYKKAEAKIRAISTFSDDSMLRLKSNILLSRIYALEGMVEESSDIIMTLLSGSSEPQYELVLWAREFLENYKNEDKVEELEVLLEKIDTEKKIGYTAFGRILTPETIFGMQFASDNVNTSQTAVPGAVSSPEPAIPAGEPAGTVSIQMGSFSRQENAEDLRKVLSAEGYNPEIKKKNVNGKDYSVVVIPDVPLDELQNRMIELKEKGFEGYPLY